MLFVIVWLDCRVIRDEVRLPLTYVWSFVRVSDDILRAVRSLEPLGSGFTIINVGDQAMIRSVPKELNTDQSTVLEAIQVLGYVTVSMLRVNLGWEAARAQTVLDDLLSDGLVWIDMQADENEYWTPMRMQG